MTNGRSNNGTESGPEIEEPLGSKGRLEELKARLFPPETKAERAARAQEALRNAVRTSQLDVETIKHIAQSVDLEGF